jgi:hypothetical protein
MTLQLPHRWRVVDRHEAECAGVDPRDLRAVEDVTSVFECFLAAAWSEVRLSNGWIAAYRLASEQGRPVIAEVRVFPDVWPKGDRPAGTWAGEYVGPNVKGIPPGGVAATTLRQVTLAKPFRDALRSLARLREAFPAYFEPGTPLEPLAREPRAANSRRRPRIDDVALARIAREFVNSNYDVRAVAKASGVSVSTARGRIELARRRGLLARTGKQGQTGSALTDSAEQLLRQVSRGKGRRKS